jgi:hypothetical protein
MFCINLSTKCKNHLGRLPEGNSAEKLVVFALHNTGSLIGSFRRDIFKLVRITLLAVVYEVVVCET